MSKDAPHSFISTCFSTCATGGLCASQLHRMATYYIYIYIYTHIVYAYRLCLLAGRPWLHVHTYIATYFSTLQSSYSCCQQRGVLPLWMFVGRVGGKYSLHRAGALVCFMLYILHMYYEHLWLVFSLGGAWIPLCICSIRFRGSPPPIVFQ